MPTSFKMVGLGLLLTLIGIVMVQKDIRLRIWGKKADATIMGAWERTGRRSSSVQLDILFIDDAGNSVKGTCGLPSGITPEEGRTLPIVYLSGDSSVYRLATESSGFSYLIFLGGLGLTAFGAWYFTKESVNEAHQQTSEDVEKWKEHPKPKDIARNIMRNMP
jgi:hypothetical protein